MSNKIIVMLGSSSTAMGGVTSVVNTYRQAGLFQSWPIVYIDTHVEGNKQEKLVVAFSALTRFAFMLVSGQVALLHAHTSERASFWRKSIFMLLAFAAKCPVIYHSHAPQFLQFYYDECGPLARWFVRFILDHSARVVVLSSQWKTAFANITKNPNVICIFNPVVVVPVGELTQQQRAPILLFLGRLGERKGIYDLLEAAAKVRLHFPDMRLLCGGDGDLEGVAARAKELGVAENVRILGWVAGIEKQRLLAEASIYILPSYNEGLPMGVLEAMSAGLPVVTTPVGGIPDAVQDGVEGYLVEPGDIDGLANAIEKLLADAELRGRMGLAGRSKVDACFTPERVLPKVMALYQELGMVPNR